MDPLLGIVKHLVEQLYETVVSCEEERRRLGKSARSGELSRRAPGPVVSRSVSKVLCLHCACANEEDFIFCKKCGVRSGLVADPPLLCPPRVLGTTDIVDIDEDSLERRKLFIRQSIADTKYDKETDSVMKKFEIFVSSRWDNAKKRASIYEAIPADVVDFLIWKDTTELKGRTYVHVIECPLLGLESATECGTEGCGFRHTAQSLRVGQVEKLKKGFRELGVVRPWDPETASGNPADARDVKVFIKFVEVEQAKAGIRRKKAAIILKEEVNTLLVGMTALLCVVGISDEETFVILLFRAVFAIAFSSTKRGDALSYLLVTECLRCSSGKGLTLNFAFDKTLRGQTWQAFGVARSSDPLCFCPVRFLDEYVDFAKRKGYPMKGSFLFFLMKNGQKCRLLPQQMTDALKKYLAMFGLPVEGKTMHSFRSGGAVTKILEGESLAQVMGDAFWKTEAVARDYMRLEQVLIPFNAELGNTSTAQYKEMNEAPVSESMRKWRAY